MKLIILLLVCMFPFSALPQEKHIKLQNGNTVQGSISQYIPASIVVKTDAGELTIPVNSLSYESITNLPANISGTYKKLHDLQAVIDTETPKLEKFYKDQVKKNTELTEAWSNALGLALELQSRFNNSPTNFAGLQVVYANAKATEDSGKSVRISWKVQVNNTRSDSCKNTVVFRFIDHEKYLRDTDRVYSYIFNPGISEVTGSTIMPVERWQNIESFNVILDD